jgi:ribonuclease Z
MKITFIGTSSGVPTKKRNVSGIALKFNQSSDWLLVDCGEATQHQLLFTPYSLPKLKHIFITHLHGDHCFGLFGLLATRSMNNAKEPLSIIGPVGIHQLLKTVFKITKTHFPFKIEISEINPQNTQFEIPRALIRAVPLEHSVPSYAFIIQEKPKAGKFNVELAKAKGIPPGPIYGKLKRGKKVKLPNGEVLNGKDFIKKPLRGRKIIIAGDNKNPELLLPYLKGCDLLIHEANYTEKVKDFVKEEFYHSTACDVAKVVHKAGVPNLILTHFSARFSLEYSRTKKYFIDELLQEAKAEYSGNCFLASDFDTYHLSAEGELYREKTHHKRT